MELSSLLLGNKSVFFDVFENCATRKLRVRHGRSCRHDAPILLICYTNHALDQFLEDLLDLPDFGSILRFGGRSKSENQRLHDCMVHNHMRGVGGKGDYNERMQKQEEV